MPALLLVLLVVAAGAALALWVPGALPSPHPPGRRLLPVERSERNAAALEVAIALGTAVGVVVVAVLVVTL